MDLYLVSERCSNVMAENSLILNTTFVLGGASSRSHKKMRAPASEFLTDRLRFIQVARMERVRWHPMCTTSYRRKYQEPTLATFHFG